MDVLEGGGDDPLDRNASLNPKSVLFQVLSTGKVKSELSIFFTVMAQRGTAISLFLGHSGYMASDRNQAIHEWLKDSKADFLIQCDEDMVPPLDITKMAEWKKDIVSCVYLYGGDRGPTVGACGLEGEPVFPIQKGEPQLKEVAWIGTGCYCISRPAAEHLIERNGQVFEFDFDERGGKKTGCDVFMCRKAREHGLKVWLDRGMISGHVKSATWTPHPENGMLTFQPWGSYWNGDNIPLGVKDIEPLPELIRDITEDAYVNRGEV